jgi:hypothetical protein
MNAPDNVLPITRQNRPDLYGKRLGVSLEVYIGLQRHAFFPDQSRGRKRTPSLRGMDDEPAGRSGRIDVMWVIFHIYYEPYKSLYVKNKMGMAYFYAGGAAQGNRIWVLSPGARGQQHPSRSSEAIALERKPGQSGEHRLSFSREGGSLDPNKLKPLRDIICQGLDSRLRGRTTFLVHPIALERKPYPLAHRLPAYYR